MSSASNLTLVYSALELAVSELAADPQGRSAWTAARAALVHHGVSRKVDPEFDAAIGGRAYAALGSIVAG